MMFDQVKLLYENCIWSSIVQLAPYALSNTGCPEANDSGDIKSVVKKHLMLVMVGDSYFESREFKKAEPIYKEAIQMRKHLKSMKKTDGTSFEDQTGEGKLAANSSDVEVKFKLHLCYINTNQVSPQRSQERISF